MANLELDKQLEKMRTDWDERARENARYYVSTGKKDWTDEEFFRSGELFKFQVQGDASLTTDPDDTWLGVPFSDEAAVAMAERCGFEPRHRHGAGEQYFWLWYFKR